jgi:hypothetical protein
LIKRIIRLLAVTALVVLALALPAFAQEEQTCYDRNGDGTYRCGGELLIPLNEADDNYNEGPPWYTPGGYGYPWDYGDEDDGDSPWDYGYPMLGSGDECYEDDDACEDAQEAWEDAQEAWEEYLQAVDALDA